MGLFKKREKIELGQEVKDEITGFQGIVTGEVSYITGCTQFLVQPRATTPDKKPDSEWFDHERLNVVGQGIGDPQTQYTPGGPDSPAPRR